MPRSCELRFGGCRRVAAVLSACLFLAGSAWAGSTIIDPASGYRADDLHTSITVKDHAVSGDLLAIYDSIAGLQLFDRAANARYNLNTSGVEGDSWASFVTFSPSGDSIWVGYDYNIYEVTNIRGTPEWNFRAKSWFNFDLAFSDGAPYISGPNVDSYGPNAIWRLDTSGNNNHELVVATGGFSAGLDFDADGYLYYATNLGSGDKLVRFSPEDVAKGNLTLANADTLADIPFPSYDTKVDAAGHVIFDFNDGDWLTGTWDQRGSALAVWNGTVDSGENYDLIGTAGAGHWFSYLSVEGNPIYGDGAIYLNDGAYSVPCPGLAEVRPVPEPTSLVLLAVGAITWLLWRRKGLRM